MEQRLAKGVGGRWAAEARSRRFAWAMPWHIVPRQPNAACGAAWLPVRSPGFVWVASPLRQRSSACRQS
jgi:hypothetical protein